MRLVMMAVLPFIGLLILFAQADPVAAASSGCSFRKTVRQGSYAFDVTSRPADGCGVQVIKVIVRQGGRQIAAIKTDVDFLAEAAWAVDLDGDGKPELVVASRSAGAGGHGTFDVYWLEGKTLRRATMAPGEEGAGYQGHDGFRLDGGSIVRRFPVYRTGDADDRPGGGMRTLQYAFHDGKLELGMQSEAPAATASQATAPTVRKARAKASPVEEYPRAAPPEFFLPKASRPLAQPPARAAYKPVPEEGYPRAAPPEFYLQKDSHQPD